MHGNISVFQILFQVVSVLREKGFYISVSLKNNPRNKVEQCFFSISEALRSHAVICIANLPKKSATG